MSLFVRYSPSAIGGGGGGGGGVSVIGSIDGNGASANGASINGSSLFMQSASISNPGLMNLTTQSFAGAKTFTKNLTITGSSDAVQLSIQGHSTQTNLVLEVLSSGFSDLLTLSNAGDLAIGNNINATGRIAANYYVGASASPAASGVYRLPNTEAVAWRNTLNNGDKTLSLDSANVFQFDSAVNSSGNITGANLSGTNTGDVTLGTASGLSLVNQVLSLALASTSTTGALSNTDWNTFNGKQASGNYLTALSGDGTAAGPGSSALTLATVNSNVGNFTLANITVNGKGLVTAASSTAVGNLTAAGTDGIAITSGTGAVIGAGTSIAQHVADTTHNGYLSSTDWNTFNGKGAGTVTSVTFTGDGTVLSSTPSSAVTASGTVTAALKNQNATLALVGPAYGASAAAPTFRAIVGNDIATVIQSKSATYGVLATDDQVICSGAAFTATLPAANAVPAGKRITFIHNDSDLSRQYTIARAGADTIQSGASKSTTSTTIAIQGEILVLQSDGTSVWYIISRTYPQIWAAYTPAVTQGFVATSIATGNYMWRRVGDSIELRARWTNGTVQGTEARISLPTGLTTASSTYLPALMKVGEWQTSQSTGWTAGGILANAALTYVQFGNVNNGGTSAGGGQLAVQNGSAITATGQLCAFNTSGIPVEGWN